MYPGTIQVKNQELNAEHKKICDNRTLQDRGGIPSGDTLMH